MFSEDIYVDTLVFLLHFQTPWAFVTPSALIYAICPHMHAYGKINEGRELRIMFPSYKVKYALLRIVVPYLWVHASPALVYQANQEC